MMYNCVAQERSQVVEQNPNFKILNPLPRGINNDIPQGEQYLNPNDKNSK